MVNQVVLVGRIAHDARIYHATQTRIVFTVAVARPPRTAPGADNGPPSADYIPCVLWGARGQALLPHLTQGRLVRVEGRLRVRRVTDAAGSRQVADVHVDTLRFLDPAAASADRPPASAGWMPLHRLFAAVRGLHRLARGRSRPTR
jgi:single-strand DNA-binding protein